MFLFIYQLPDVCFDVCVLKKHHQTRLKNRKKEKIRENKELNIHVK